VRVFQRKITSKKVDVLHEYLIGFRRDTYSINLYTWKEYNSFTEISKNDLDTGLKIILLAHQNNYVNSSMMSNIKNILMF